MAGWLGPLTGSPAEFLKDMEFNPLPCHMQAENYNSSGHAKKILPHPCIGSMQFCANSTKYPRGAREAGHYQNLFEKYSHPNVKVFKWGNDFIQHHTTEIALSIKNELKNK